MPAASFLKADHELAKIRPGEPSRHHLTQHATAIAVRVSLAGDDEHDAVATRLGASEKGGERSVGAILPHAMQVYSGVDLDLPLSKPPQCFLLERSERRPVSRIFVWEWQGTAGPSSARLLRGRGFRRLCRRSVRVVSGLRSLAPAKRCHGPLEPLPQLALGFRKTPRHS